MQFGTGDLIIILVYFLVTFTLGLSFFKRAGSGLTEYFLSGRRAPWWLAGTGMVATTFAADTPLWVAGQVAQQGISANWLWWSYAAGGMLTVFFFARLWRRAGILTDVELIELRYSGPLVAILRPFKAVYFGFLLNALILAWVNLAMLKILTILLPGVNPYAALVCCAAVTAVYVMLAGLWGVAAADVFQFVVALGGCILLAVLAVNSPLIQAKGGLTGALSADTLSFFPRIGGDNAKVPGAYSLTWPAFFAFVCIQWWAAWYPGNEPGGGGYVAQRIMSARDERHGTLATLWFVIAHYCLRSWPWIIAGLAALVLFPELAADKKEDGFVYLMRDVLPSPLRGLLFAAFLGAYMSTISTQLNWGAGYLINDGYARYLNRNQSDRHYVLVSRILVGVLLAVSLVVTVFVLESIKGAWSFLIEFGAGTGFVLILRWYWWRVNAAAELVSMASSMLAVLVIKIVLPALFGNVAFLKAAAAFPNSLFLIVAVNIVATLVTIYVTTPVEQERLRAFYLRVLPPGPGWLSFRRKAAISEEPIGSIGRMFLGWVAGTGLVYTLLFAIGNMVLGRMGLGLLLLIPATLCGGLIAYVVRREFSQG